MRSSFAFKNWLVSKKVHTKGHDKQSRDRKGADFICETGPPLTDTNELARWLVEQTAQDENETGSKGG